MDSHDRADDVQPPVDSDEFDSDGVSVGRKKSDKNSGVDVISVLIALGLAAAVIWFFFYRT